VSKVKAVFLREFLERVRRRSFIVGLVLMPLFMSLAIGLPLLLVRVEDESSSTALVIDESGRYKAAFEEAIQSTLESGEERFLFLDLQTGGSSADPNLLTDPGQADLLLEDEILDWYVLIPDGLADGLEAEFHGRVVSNIALLDMLETKLTEVLRQDQLRALDLDPDLLRQISSRARLRTLQHQGGETSEAGFLSLYFGTMAMVMILFMTITLYGTMIQRSILEDKNQHVTEVVLSSIDSTRFFVGKILGIGAVGLTQYLAWMLLALGAGLAGGLAGMELQQLPSLQPMVLFHFVLFYVLGFLFYAGLFGAVGAMSTTDQEAQQLSQPLTMMMVLPAVIMIYIFQNPNAPIPVALSLVPFFSPLVMFMRINISIPPLWQILTSVAILVVSIAVVFAITGRIFRVGILMTGKKASVIEAWRWARRA